MARTHPRQINVRFARDLQTGREHNVLEFCDPKYGVRYVMAQDSETHKERDKYKLRVHLLEEELKKSSDYIERLQDRLDFLEEVIQAALKDAIRLLEELREEEQ